MGPFVIIYSINYVLVIIRPGIAMEIGFTKRNRCRKCGLPVDSPLTLFWDCKNSPGFWDVTAWYQSLGIRIPRA